MKIALITDQHFGVRNDNRNLLTNQIKFYNDIFFPELKSRNITQIIDLGDSFDKRKNINIHTLQLAKDNFFDKIKEYGMKMDTIVGNHTAYYRNTNYPNTMGEVFKDEEHITVYAEPTEVEYDGLKILYLPWINNQNEEKSINLIDTTDAPVIMGHLEIIGCYMQRGMLSSHGLPMVTFSKFDHVFSGHFHTRSVTGNIHYLGCPYEMNWQDYKDPKGFHIYDTDTRTLEFIENPYNSFFKIKYDDANVDWKDLVASTDFPSLRGGYIKIIRISNKNPYHFDMFMEELYKHNPANIQIVEDHMNRDLEKDSDIIEDAEDTVTTMSKYVESLITDVDKAELDKLMRSLYNEALDFED
jgi:hypothetical protein